MTRITTHVLNTTKGIPATGISVVLHYYGEEGWTGIARAVTDESGRVNDFFTDNGQLPDGMYKLVFETGVYFELHSAASFYPFVEIVFNVKDKGHYHVPLLLNPFGYSTYRGT